MNDPLLASRLPYLTRDLPGTGGCLRRRPEDFEVEEMPLYEPCGEGTHAYLEIEKTGISTFEAIHRIARRLGRREAEFGHAGIKDTHARTIQCLSIEHPGLSLAELEAMEIEGLRVRSARWHRNKLRVGHLRGNRFAIRITGVGPDAVARARAVVDLLARRGMPNFFGPQRFGTAETTHLLGRALVRGSAGDFFDALLVRPMPSGHGAPVLDASRQDHPPEAVEEPPGQRTEIEALYRAGRFEEAAARLPRSAHWERRGLIALARNKGRPERALRGFDRRMLRFYIAAYQSALFNRVLASRLSELDGLRDGDVAFIHAKGACFVVEEAGRERSRVERFEISASGPLFGFRLLEATGEPGRIEREVLEGEGLELASFGARRLTALKGARRPLRVPVIDPIVEDRGDDLEVRFSLPPGSYATVLLGEIIKE